jgi:hypothetical protein
VKLKSFGMLIIADIKKLILASGGGAGEVYRIKYHSKSHIYNDLLASYLSPLLFLTS